MGNNVGYQRLGNMPAEDDVIPPGDPEKGAEIFREHCAGCHDIDKRVIWGDRAIFDYLEKPHIPGTKFLFRDLKGKDEDKAHLVAYLKKMTDAKNS